MKKGYRMIAFATAALALFGMTACHPDSAPSSSAVSMLEGSSDESQDASAESDAADLSSENQSVAVSSKQASSTVKNRSSKPVASQATGSKPASSITTVTSSEKEAPPTQEDPPEEESPVYTGIPSEAAAKTLEDLFAGKLKEERDLYRSSGINGMHFTDSVWVDGVCYTYYISYVDNKMGVSMVKSENGIDFHSPVRVLSPSESYDINYASFPGVWYLDGLFYMVYECSAPAQHIALATSTDGINFTKHGIILRTDRSLSWQNHNIGTPDLYWEDGVWYLTFHGFGSDKRDCQIGIAYGEDIFNLTMVKEPIIPTSNNPNDPDSGTTGRRDIIKAGDWYYMVYEISTDIGSDGSFASSIWGHSFARSKDMLSWEVIQSYVPITTGGGMGLDGPSWMVVGDEIWVHCRMNNNTYAYSFVAAE